MAERDVEAAGDIRESYDVAACEQSRRGMLAAGAERGAIELQAMHAAPSPWEIAQHRSRSAANFEHAARRGKPLRSKRYDLSLRVQPAWRR